MIYARVVGRVVTCVAVSGLKSLPLLLVQPLTPEGKPRGAIAIATDRIGVGTGEPVLLESSREAGLGLPDPLTPTDLSIVARVDTVTLHR